MLLDDQARLLTELRLAKERIDALPDLLRDVREQVFAAKSAITPLQNAIKDRESETMQIVESLRIDDVTRADHGKPLFSNDAARKAEVKRRLQSDASHGDVAQSLARAEKVKERLEIQLSTLENEFRAKHAYIDATCAEVRLLTGR